MRIQNGPGFPGPFASGVISNYLRKRTLTKKPMVAAASGIMIDQVILEFIEFAIFSRSTFVAKCSERSTSLASSAFVAKFSERSISTDISDFEARFSERSLSRVKSILAADKSVSSLSTRFSSLSNMLLPPSSPPPCEDMPALMSLLLPPGLIDDLPNSIFVTVAT